jgi:curved DNA-binding protein CbpA
MKDYYKILGLRWGCSELEIKTSYRTLAKKWHPDKNKSPNAKEMFIEIHEAYEILINPQKRNLYDKVFLKNRVAIVNNYSQKRNDTYEQYAKEAHSKAEYFSKISFDKYFSLFLSGVDKVHTGCAYIFITGWAIFFVIMGFYGIGILIQGIFNQNVALSWRSVIGFVLMICVSGLFFYAAYRIFKKVAKAI